MRAHPFVILASLLAAGCGGGGIPFLGGAPLAVTPERLTILEGDTVRLDLTGADAEDAVWAAGDTAVVTVLGAGRIAGAGQGRSLVTATLPDGRSVRAYVFVDEAVLVGAGDIAVCGYETDERTAELLDHIAGVIWTAGDNAYPSGSARDFAECFDPTWGRHKDRIRPTPGNHEYRTPGASAYFDYFGEAAGERGKGWYSYRYGGWLIIALNSNLSALDEDTIEEQMDWLRDTLEDNPVLCTLAYFHHPLFSSGSHGSNDDEDVRPIYEALYAAGADVVLAGHDHHYERFPPLDPSGRNDPRRGIRQFLVGSGGGALRSSGSQVHPQSEVFNNRDHGVLELVLHEDGYEWQFVTVEGSGGDSGRGSCH